MSRLILPTRRKVLAGLSALAAPAIIRPASATLLVDGIPASPIADCDPYWSSVVLLMGFEGADGATGAPGMTDESPAAHGNATVVGTADIDTAQFKFGTSSLELTGAGNITFADSNDWNFSNGLFTVECWFRFTDIANGQQYLISQWGAGGNLAWRFQANTIISQIVWGVSVTGADSFSDLHGAASLGNNTWYALAVDYDGTTYRSYVNGAVDATSATARTIFDSTAVLSLGATSLNGTRVKGWMDEVRITKGVARYAGAYTAPTAAFPRMGC